MADSARIAPAASLAALLSPIPPESFLRDYYCRAPLYIPGETARFSDLLSWDGLNRASTIPRKHRPALRLAKDGKVLSEAEFSAKTTSAHGEFWRVDFNAVRRLLEGGATLVLDRIDEAHEPIAEVCRMLEAELGSTAFADAFASWRQTPGFPTHWDPEQVFIAQVIGTKHWRVLKPDRLHPTQQDKGRRKESAPRESYWEGDLNAGDLLYIPGGWWHDAVAVSERTLHVSLSLFPSTGLTLTNHLLRTLEDEELARMPLPRFAPESEQEDYMRRLRSLVDSKMRALTVNWVIGQLDARAPARNRLSLPWSAVPRDEPIPHNAWIHWLPPRPIMVRETSAEFVFEALGTRFAFPISFLPIVKDLIVSRRLPCGEICARHSHAPVEKILLGLVSAGLIAIAEQSVI